MTAREARAHWVIFVLGLSGCTGDTRNEAVTLTPVENWTTEAEYEFGDRFEGDALFALIVDVALGPNGSRVYVLDKQAAEVTIWTPGGNLIIDIWLALGHYDSAASPSFSTRGEFSNARDES